MKTTIIGGNFSTGKSSGIIKKMSENFDNPTIINGGTLEILPMNISSDLIIWMPDISNETEKQYPKKDIGNVLICSKVMRENYTDIDAVSRIFKMNGNAVIALYKKETVYFKLIDALGNAWYNGNDINLLCETIKEFYNFTKTAIRVNSLKMNIIKPNINSDVSRLIEINNRLAEYIQLSCGNRFFGNLSTRCQKLFPSTKIDDISMFVSPRNVNKSTLTNNDMVYCKFIDNKIGYIGDNKPSVDTPTQLLIYKNFKNINYMIHGHAFIDNVIETENYCLCGDIREYDEIKSLIVSDFGALNLKNHGFLLYSDTLDNLENLIKTLTFTYRR